MNTHVLIIDRQNNHDWQRVTPVLRRMPVPKNFPTEGKISKGEVNYQ